IEASKNNPNGPTLQALTSGQINLALVQSSAAIGATLSDKNIGIKYLSAATRSGCASTRRAAICSAPGLNGAKRTPFPPRSRRGRLHDREDHCGASGGRRDPAKRALLGLG